MKTRHDTAVTQLLEASKHPLREAIEVLRTITLDSHGRIEEGVKWNTASFRTTEWFATLNGPKQVKNATIILHAGAKAKGAELKGRIKDPEGMITWLGADRGMVTFGSLADIEAKRKALQELIQAWIANG